ncbi:MAG: PorT family protein [Rikenellaceae bacterium]|nr:PorT family protein [Rikenellaceae bacterium]
MGKDRFDELLREKLEGLEAVPRASAWDRIEADLAGRVPVAVPRRRLWLRGAVAAALILGVLVTGLTYLLRPVEPVAVPLAASGPGKRDQGRGELRLTEESRAEVLAAVEARRSQAGTGRSGRVAGTESAADRLAAAVAGHTAQAGRVAADLPSERAKPGETPGQDADRVTGVPAMGRMGVAGLMATNGTVQRAGFDRSPARNAAGRKPGIYRRTTLPSRWSAGIFAGGLGGSTHVSGAGPRAVAMMSSMGIEEVYDRKYLAMMNAASASVKLDHKMPISAGVSVRWRLSPHFGVETGLIYTYLESGAEADGAGVFGYRIKQRLHYLGLPLSAVYTAFERSRFELYARGGVMFEKCLSATQSRRVGIPGGGFGPAETFDLNAGGLQVSVGLGLGASVRLAGPASIYLEPGVNYYIPGNQPDSYRTEHPWNFSLRAGFRFDF